jgi:hypothetical protein
MTRTFRLIVVLGAVALTGLASPSIADAQRRPPAGRPVSRGSAQVAVPRTSAPYGHSYYRGYSRPYYGSYYRPYYRPYYYSSHYYPYYSPWSFSIGFGFGSYANYAPYYAYPPYAYPHAYAYPSTYATAYPSSYPYPSSGYDSPPADRTQTAPPSRSSDFGTLSLRVSPADAVILIDHEEWDRPQGGDRFSIELAAGPHLIEVHKQGYGSYVRTIDVPLDRTMLWNVALTPGGSTPQVARTVPLKNYR